MPPITNKAQMLENLAAARANLEATIAKLNPEQREAPGVVGELSAKDVLAHLAEWEQMHIEWVASGQRGEKQELPAPGLTFKAADVERLNRMIFEKHCHKSWDEVVGWFRAVHAEFIAQVEAISEEDLWRDGYVPFTNKLYNWYGHFIMHDNWGRKHIHDKWIRKPRKKAVEA